jgi:hypothetical protein
MSDPSSERPAFWALLPLLVESAGGAPVGPAK